MHSLCLTGPAGTQSMSTKSEYKERGKSAILDTVADRCICVICAVLLDALCKLLTAMQGPGNTCRPRQQLERDDAINPPGPLGRLCRGLLFLLGSRPSPARQPRHPHACWPLSADSSLRRHPQVLRCFSVRLTSAQGNKGAFTLGETFSGEPCAPSASPGVLLRRAFLRVQIGISSRREKLTSSFPLPRLWQQKHEAQTGPRRPQSLRSPGCPPP